MSNSETILANNSTISENNTDLNSILTAINELPAADSNNYITSVNSTYLTVSNQQLSLNYTALVTALKNEFIAQSGGTTKALWIGTQAQYDAITTKDSLTTYIIQGSE